MRERGQQWAVGDVKKEFGGAEMCDEFNAEASFFSSLCLVLCSFFTLVPIVLDLCVRRLIQILRNLTKCGASG